MAMTGGCLCGKVRYQVESDPLMCMTCHCKNCQRQSGSSLSIIVGVPKDAVKIDGVEHLKTYHDTGDSGAGVDRQFCGECGSPVFTVVEQRPEMLFIKAGTLDDTSSLNPAFHIFTKSKQEWVDLGDIPCFEAGPEGI